MRVIWMMMGLLGLAACSPVKLPVSHQYQLSTYSERQLARHPSRHSILVTTPTAMADYQTEEMVYIQKPYQLDVFASNAWVSPPAEMLYPLIVQSLQKSGYFYAVASSAYALTTDYRLDTQLIKIQQNFLTRPSRLELTVKATLTRNRDSKVVASREFNEIVPCSQGSPYGGVLAANVATRNLTARMTEFVVANVRR